MDSSEHWLDGSLNRDFRRAGCVQNPLVCIKFPVALYKASSPPRYLPISGIGLYMEIRFVWWGGTRVVAGTMWSVHVGLTSRHVSAIHTSLRCGIRIRSPAFVMVLKTAFPAWISDDVTEVLDSEWLDGILIDSWKPRFYLFVFFKFFLTGKDLTKNRSWNQRVS